MRCGTIASCSSVFSSACLRQMRLRAHPPPRPSSTPRRSGPRPWRAPPKARRQARWAGNRQRRIRPRVTKRARHRRHTRPVKQVMGIRPPLHPPTRRQARPRRNPRRTPQRKRPRRTKLPHPPRMAPPPHLPDMSPRKKPPRAYTGARRRHMGPNTRSRPLRRRRMPTAASPRTLTARPPQGMSLHRRKSAKATATKPLPTPNRHPTNRKPNRAFRPVGRSRAAPPGRHAPSRSTAA